MFQVRIMAWAHANGKTYFLFDCFFCFLVHYVLGYESCGVCFWLFVFQQAQVQTFKHQLVVVVLRMQNTSRTWSFPTILLG